MQLSKKELLPKIQNSGLILDMIKKLLGVETNINITINQPQKSDKLTEVNQEMLKMMKKEKEPVFEEGKELKANKYIYGARANK